MNERLLRQFDRQMRSWELLNAAGKQRDPVFLVEWLWGNSPLDDGKHAARFQEKLENKLAPLVLAQELLGGRPVQIPAVPANRAVFIGCEVGSGRHIQVDANVFNLHGLIIGATGTGKTTFLVRILDAMMRRQRLHIILQDHKGEGRRLLKIFGRRVMVFRPDQEPWNMLAPVGHADAYWWGFASELGHAFNLRSETWTELPGTLKRIHTTLQPGEPSRSMKDFERILRHLSVTEQRHKLETAASAVASLNHFLGRTAYIRKAPDVEERYPIIVYEHLGLPPRIHSFLTAIRLLRLQMKSAAEGIA